MQTNIRYGGGFKYKHLAYIMFVIGLILLVIGVSYAIYTFMGTGTTENVITTGQIKISFAEKNNITITNRYPETDIAGLANTDSNSNMTFTISGEIVGDATVNYAVGLTDIVEGSTLKEDYIKIYLTKDGKVAKGFSENIGRTIKSFSNVSVENYLDSHVIAQDSITGTNIHTYTLKAWIDEDYNLPTEETTSGTTHSSNSISETFSFKLKVIGVQEVLNGKSSANAPELATNMIPVTYDSGSNTWVKADSTNSSNSWYNYDDKKWANAVTVTSTNRETYLKASVGTPIAMSDINTMWVWIPSFKATIPSIDCSTITNSTVEEYPMCYNITLTDQDQTSMIQFLVGMFSMSEEEATANVTTLQNGGTFDYEGVTIDMNFAVSYYESYYTMAGLNEINPIYTYDSSINTTLQSFDISFTSVGEASHDAFTFGNETLSGFWMAKFEPSHKTLSEQTDYDLLACTNETCENAKGIEVLPNKVSLRRNNVSNFFYASRSMEQNGNPYGLVSSEVDTHMMKNNEWAAVSYLTYSLYGRCETLTNCKDIGINNNGETENYSNITGYGAPAGSDMSAENGAYNTTLGMDASTTGNIYGIYDMSGGAFEYVMGVYKPATLDGITDWSGFSSSTSNAQFDLLPDAKYYNVYTTSEAYDNAGLQHAVNETNGWYGDVVDFVSPDGPWFGRGAYLGSGSVAGVFTAFSLSGYGYFSDSFRPALVK